MVGLNTKLNRAKAIAGGPLLSAILLVGLLGCEDDRSAGSHQRTLTVAVAANFAHTARALLDEFAVAQDVARSDLILVVGSTGKLYAQIEHGAPFDVFMSADQTRVDTLVQSGQGIAETQFTYALGQLVLWRNASWTPASPDGAQWLRTPVLRRIALANPQLAPYGKAAMQVLTELGIAQQVAAKLVIAENVGQTHALVATGNAEVGFLAQSLVVTLQSPALQAAAASENDASESQTWVVPPALYHAIRQDAVLTRYGADNQLARAWLRWLQSPRVRAKIAADGYRLDDVGTVAVPLEAADAR